MKNLLIITMATLLFVACGEKKVSLDDTSWNLVELNGKSLDRATLTDTSTYTLNFEKEKEEIKAYGMGECNRFFGNITCDMESGAISMSNLASTRAMCPNQQQEDEYIQGLTSSKTYKVKNNQLMLLNDKNVVVAKFAKK